MKTTQTQLQSTHRRLKVKRYSTSRWDRQPPESRQHCAKRNAPVFNLLRGRFWGFSPRRGDMLQCTDWGDIWHGRGDHLNRCNG